MIYRGKWVFNPKRTLKSPPLTCGKEQQKDGTPVLLTREVGGKIKCSNGVICPNCNIVSPRK